MGWKFSGFGVPTAWLKCRVTCLDLNFVWDIRYKQAGFAGMFVAVLIMEFQRIARRDKKAFLCEQCKKIDENVRMGHNSNLLKKTGDIREHFMQR